MHRHRIFYALLLLSEALTLAGFFLSGHMADAQLPETGGNGEPEEFWKWSAIGGWFFCFLALLWICSASLSVRDEVAKGKSAIQALACAQHGVAAWATGMPLFGLIAGYVLGLRWNWF